MNERLRACERRQGSPFVASTPENHKHASLSTNYSVVALSTLMLQLRPNHLKAGRSQKENGTLREHFAALAKENDAPEKQSTVNEEAFPKLSTALPSPRAFPRAPLSPASHRASNPKSTKLRSSPPPKSTPAHEWRLDVHYE